MLRRLPLITIYQNEGPLLVPLKSLSTEGGRPLFFSQLKPLAQLQAKYQVGPHRIEWAKGDDPQLVSGCRCRRHEEGGTREPPPHDSFSMCTTCIYQADARLLLTPMGGWDGRDGRDGPLTCIYHCPGNPHVRKMKSFPYGA